MTLEAIEKRLAELRKLMEEPDADLKAINQEVDELIEKRSNLLAEQEKENRKKIIDDVLANGRVVKTFAADITQAQEFNADSPEYRMAYLKRVARKADGSGNLIPMFGDLTEKEERAFVMTTQNTGQVIPTVTANKIVELVKSSNAMIADLTPNRFLSPYEVPRHTKIEEGDAALVDEDKVPEDEKDLFDMVQILGKDFKKGVTLSENMRIQSIDAFEQWLVNHVVARLYHAANAYVYTKVEEGMDEANKVTTAQGLTDDDLLKALARVTGGNVKIYANRKTIYSYLATIKDEQGRQIFYDAAANPLERGIIHGAMVKEDSSLADETLYIGAPELIESNIFEDANVLPLPQKGRMTYYDGFMKFDAGLLDPKGFVKVTITPAV